MQHVAKKLRTTNYLFSAFLCLTQPENCLWFGSVTSWGLLFSVHKCYVVQKWDISFCTNCLVLGCTICLECLKLAAYFVRKNNFKNRIEKQPRSHWHCCECDQNQMWSESNAQQLRSTPSLWFEERFLLKLSRHQEGGKFHYFSHGMLIKCYALAL